MTTRERLSNRRFCETFELEAEGMRYTCSIGRFDDGRIAEIFLNNRRSGSDADLNARDAAVLASIALQMGASPWELVHSIGRSPIGTVLEAVAKMGGDDAVST